MSSRASKPLTRTEQPLNSDMMIGEIRGQLRELINTMEKVDGRLEKIEDRLSDLEMINREMQGVKGVLAALLKSPLIGWLAAGGIALWGMLTGRVHP